MRLACSRAEVAHARTCGSPPVEMFEARLDAGGTPRGTVTRLLRQVQRPQGSSLAPSLEEGPEGLLHTVCRRLS